MNFSQRLAAIKQAINEAALAAGRAPESVQLCAATKTQSDETIKQAIASGIRLCGENRAQELTQHLQAGAYAGAEVHFIGHLQSNKVKQVVGNVALIQSVDSPRLLRAIDSRARELGLVQDILLQVNVGQEDSKGGCPPAELLALAELADGFLNVRLRGLMAIPPAATIPGNNLTYFSAMSKLYIDIREKISHNQWDINCLSMGMSGDFHDAIAQGATLIRLGTALFGPRPAMGDGRV